MQTFKIKACGITNPADALATVAAGADAIGLNFYERSLRSVDPTTALEIISVIPSSFVVVGVFVNHGVQDILELAEHLQFSAIQLHGDERPEIIDELGVSNIIRAIRIDGESDQALEGAQREIDAWCEHGAAGILVDKAVGRAYGGTGETFDWSLLDRLNVPVRTILAGGLTPDNVAAAIEKVKPDAVDVASGIENFPGGKDVDLLKAFVKYAQAAFAG